MRSILCGILSILLVGTTFSATKKVILLKHGPDFYASNIAKNIKYIETLPIDGTEVEAMPASATAMDKNTTIPYADVYDQLKLVQGISQKINTNFTLIYMSESPADPPEWYNEAGWARVIANWRLVARASKAAGMKGIFFDNEQYTSKGWNYLYDYPTMVDSASKYTLDQYRAQTRLRGKQLMQVCIEEFPNIEVMLYHGPYFSEPKIPTTLDKSNAQWAELMGALFVGFVEGAIGTQAIVTDGGECGYAYRTADQFQNSYEWRKNVIASASNNSPNIPASIRPYWAQKVKISFGLYKQDGNAPCP